MNKIFSLVVAATTIGTSAVGDSVGSGVGMSADIPVVYPCAVRIVQSNATIVGGSSTTYTAVMDQCIGGTNQLYSTDNLAIVAYWTSSNTGVATVSSGFRYSTPVVAVASGSATITVSISPVGYPTVTDTRVVTVLDPLTPPTLSGYYDPPQGNVLSWNAVAGATGYVVYVYDYCTDFGGPDGPWSYAQRADDVPTTSTTVSLDPNSQCPQQTDMKQYFVVATKPGVTSGLSNDVQFYP